MSISQEDIDAQADKYEKIVDGCIKEQRDKVSGLISTYVKFGQIMGIEIDLPNIGITFHNKINEIYKIFEEAGANMYADYIGKYDYVAPNIVAEAIIDEMLSHVLKGKDVLVECGRRIIDIEGEKIKKYNEFKDAGLIKKMYLNAKSFFDSTYLSELKSWSKEEIDELNSYISKYTAEDDALWKYNLRDNIVHSLVSHINKIKLFDGVILKLLEESIIPTLQKLGLEDLVPNIKEELGLVPSNNKPWELSQAQKAEIQAPPQQKSIEIKPDENEGSR